MGGVRQCVVLMGGLATRLGGLAAQVPKPMLEVAGRPFLGWLLREASRFGIERAVLLTGHLSEVVEAALPELAAGLPKPMDLRISREPVRAGTGGALFHAAPLLDERFLLLNGDSFLDCPLGTALAGTEEPGVLGRLMLRRVTDASRYGVVRHEGERVTAFQPRPEPGVSGPGVINGGVYVLDRRVLERLGPQCSLEQDVLPGLASEGRLRCAVSDGFFIDIGVPDDLARAQDAVPRHLVRRALFLDRDGVCNLDHGWVGTRERFEWVEGARETMALATRAGWHVFLVTNQSGVARGLYGEEDVRALHGWMRDEVMALGGTIDDARYCPYHPEAAVEAYRQVSDWRKPQPGMLRDLLRAWRLDPARCVMIGDQATDMAAAAAAGVPGRLFGGGNLLDFARGFLTETEMNG